MELGEYCTRGDSRQTSGARSLSAAKPMAASKPKIRDDTALSKPVIFTTSGIGGVVGWAIVHPFNTVAVRMNLAVMGSGGQKPAGFFSFTRDMLRAEGVNSLYAGLGAGCLRQVFYATSRYGLFETFRDMMAKYRKTDFAQRFGTAAVAGGCAALISCPIEVCLVRMSNDASLPAEKRRNYGNVFNAVMRIAREEGVPAFWRGSQPFVMRAMVVGGTQVATYDQFKLLYSFLGSGLANQFAASMSAATRYPRDQISEIRSLGPRQPVGRLHFPPPGRSTRSYPRLRHPRSRLTYDLGEAGPMTAGARSALRSAGLIYSIITMPLETAKNRMAFQKPDPATGKLPFTGTVQVRRDRARSGELTADI
jgi:solute carrier family 25 oxoglutarate transporter 11